MRNGVIGLSCMLRLTLINGYFGGTPDQVSISELLRVAYEDFTSCRKSKKIPCSQRMFKASQVDRLAHGAFWLRRHGIPEYFSNGFMRVQFRLPRCRISIALEGACWGYGWLRRFAQVAGHGLLQVTPHSCFWSHWRGKVSSVLIFVMLHPRHAC